MKKRLLLVFALILAAAPVSAKDIDEGTIEVNSLSSIILANQTVAPDGLDVDVNLLSVNVAGGYYLMPNLAVGPVLMYEKAEVDFDLGGLGSISTTISGVALGAVARYNFALSEDFNLFADLALALFNAKVEVDDESEDDTGLFFTLGGGVRYFTSDEFSIDARLGYDTTLAMDVEVSGFVFGAGFTVYFE